MNEQRSLLWGTYRRGREGRDVVCSPEQLQHVPLVSPPARLSGKSVPVVGVWTWLHGCEDGEKSPSLVTSLLEEILHFGF